MRSASSVRQCAEHGTRRCSTPPPRAARSGIAYCSFRKPKRMRESNDGECVSASVLRRGILRTTLKIKLSGYRLAPQRCIHPCAMNAVPLVGRVLRRSLGRPRLWPS